MGRTTDPVCKLCRREGLKLYLKGARCDSPKCPIERTGPPRNRCKPPGMHGERRSKLSEYGIRLREKQRLKRFYGVFERQFRRYFEIASRSKENTGEVLLTTLERRLDNIVHRLGFAPNRASARQLVSHGHIYLNGRLCRIPSLLVRSGDTVTVKPTDESGLKLVRLYLQDNPPPPPDYLDRTNADPPEGRVTRLPARGDVDSRIDFIREQLIIEFCSR